MNKRFYFVFMAIIIALLCGCGTESGGSAQQEEDIGTSETWESSESNEESATETLESPASMEEPESKYNFNLEQDVIFFYEYDENGMVSRVYYKEGHSSKYYEDEKNYEDRKDKCLHDARNIVYDADGNLCSLEAGALSVEYNTDGKIIHVWNSGYDIEITYKSDGTIETYEKYINGTLPGTTTIFNDNYNFVSRELYMNHTDGYIARIYLEFDDGVPTHRWQYFRDGSTVEYEEIYHSNGRIKDKYQYDEKGKVLNHYQYDRDGNRIN